MELDLPPETHPGENPSEAISGFRFANIKRRLFSTPVGLYLAFQLLYGVNVMRCLPLVGDAADYASLIANGVFSVRTTHIGFYVLYYPVYRLSHWAGAHCDIAANLATSVFGALGVAVLYLFLKEIISGDSKRKMRAALVGSCIYGLSGLIWYHAEFAEVQAAMLLFLFVALAAFVRGRYVLAGIFLGLSALVSQACAPAGLWFAVMAAHRRIGLRKFLWFAGSFAVVLGAGVAPVINDFLYGPRGIFPSTEYYRPASLVKTVLSFGYRALESFWPVLPLLLLSIVLLRREKELLWIGLISIPGFTILGCRLCQVEYGFIWMPLFAIIAALAAIGWEAVLVRVRPQAGTWVTIGLVGLFGVVTYYSYLMPKQVEAARANECITEVARLIADDDFLVTGPHIGFVYAHKRWPDLPDVTLSGKWSMEAQTTLRLLSSREGVAEIYVLDYMPESHFLRRLLLDNRLARAYLPHGLRVQFLNEFDAMSETILSQDSSVNMELVLECGAARLWLVAG